MKSAKCDIVDLTKIEVAKDDVAAFSKLLTLQSRLIQRIAEKKPKVRELVRLMQRMRSNKNAAPKELYFWLEHVIASMHNEAEELRENLPWKLHKDYSGYDFNKVRVETKYEVIDLLHYVLELMLILGMDADEVLRLFYSKHMQNVERQRKGY